MQSSFTIMVLRSDLGGGDLESLSLAATSGRCCLISTVDGTAATPRPEGRSTGLDGAFSPDDDDDDEEDEELE